MASPCPRVLWGTSSPIILCPIENLGGVNPHRNWKPRRASKLGLGSIPQKIPVTKNDPLGAEFVFFPMILMIVPKIWGGLSRPTEWRFLWGGPPRGTEKKTRNKIVALFVIQPFARVTIFYSVVHYLLFSRLLFLIQSQTTIFSRSKPNLQTK